MLAYNKIIRPACCMAVASSKAEAGDWWGSGGHVGIYSGN